MANPLKNLSTPEKWAIGAGSIIVVYFAWKQHTSSAAASSSTSDPTDPATGMPTSQDNVTDPATNMTYLQEAQEYGSVAAAEQALSGSGITGLYTGGGSYGPIYGNAPVTNGNVVQGTTYGSNSAWAQAVEAGLTDIGYTSTDVSGALGRYLANLSETPAQAAIVQAAIAEYGPPPVGSYQIIQQSTTTTTGSGTTPTAVSGVHAQVINANRAQVTWSPGAPAWQVHIAGPGQSATHNVTIPSADYEGLEAGATYQVSVVALQSDGGHEVGAAQHVSFTTPKK